ncbi:Peptidoglycan-N-acetylglucosamine deacetylase [Streptomyces cyaneofuscatus]
MALTFDDGPDPVFTRQVVEILGRYGARATFFGVGHHVAALPDEVRQIAAAGHEVGNHSWSRPFLPDLTPEQLREQLDRTGEELARVTGAAPAWFRPPYGALTPEVLATLGGYPTTLTMWDVDARDWSRPGPEQIAATVLEGAGPGSVVLMHEGAGDRAQTVQALPSIIEGLLERGLQLVPVGELAATPDSTWNTPLPHHEVTDQRPKDLNGYGRALGRARRGGITPATADAAQDGPGGPSGSGGGPSAGEPANLVP